METPLIVEIADTAPRWAWLLVNARTVGRTVSWRRERAAEVCVVMVDSGSCPCDYGVFGVCSEGEGFDCAPGAWDTLFDACMEPARHPFRSMPGRHAYRGTEEF